MKKLLSFSLILFSLLFYSCSEDNGGENEYVHWKARNQSYFQTVMHQAKDSIALAQQQYGSDWESHCNWRLLLSYAVQEEAKHAKDDTICVQLLRRGDPSAKAPLATDSVRIRYRTLLMPTQKHPEGLVVDHSGQFSSMEKVFDTIISSPTTFKVGSLIRGVETALLYMKPGDFWRIYIPSKMAYASTKSEKIPAYSMLVFEADLLDCWRIGTTPPIWQ